MDYEFGVLGHANESAGKGRVPEPGEGRRCRLGRRMRHSPCPGSGRDWIWIGQNTHIRMEQGTRSRSLTDFEVCGYGKGKGGRGDATICQRTCHAYRIECLGNYDLGTASSLQSSTYGLLGGGELYVRFQEVLRNGRLVQTSPTHWCTSGRPLENISPSFSLLRRCTRPTRRPSHLGFRDISYFCRRG